MRSPRKRSEVPPGIESDLLRGEAARALRLVQAEMQQLDDRKLRLDGAWHSTQDARERKRIDETVSSINRQLRELKSLQRKLQSPNIKAQLKERHRLAVSRYQTFEFNAVTYVKPVRG